MLQLVDDEQLEESLAVETIYSKAKLRCSRAIQINEIRLSALMDVARLDETLNPLDPIQLVGFLAKASSCFELPLKARLILYKHFDKVFNAELANFYEKTDRLFVSAGLVPDIKAAIKKRHEQSDAPSDITQSSEIDLLDDPTFFSSNKTDEHTLDAADDDLLGVLSELLNRRKQAGHADFHGTPEEAAYASSETGSSNTSSIQLALDDVMDTLNRLQHELAFQPHRLSGSVSSGQSQIKKMIAQQQSRDDQTIEPSHVHFETAQEDVIDIISLLFEFILSDQNLSDQVKAQIARLQIPILKVALTDRSFFNEGRHPARILINEMSKAAASLDASVTTQDSLLHKIETSITKILNEYEAGTALFDEVLADFRDFIQQERKRSSKIEERTRTAEESKLKVENAKERVGQLIIDTVGHSNLPPITRKVIEEGWKKHLFITLLRDGEESPHWISGVETLKQLIWTLSPKENAEDRIKLLSTIPKMQRNLREGLNRILYNPFELGKLFRELEIAHVICLQETEKRIAAASSASQHADRPTEETFVATSEHTSESEPLSSSEDLIPTPAQATPLSDALASEMTETASAELASTEPKHSESQPSVSERTSELTQSQTPESKSTQPEQTPITPDALSGATAQQDHGILSSDLPHQGTTPADTDIQTTLQASERFKGDIDSLPVLDDAVDIEDLYSKQLDTIEVGTWFEFTETNGKKVRAKLSARLNKGKRLIFVNRSGFKMADLERGHLIHDLKEGKTAILDDNILFDRALESVISNLRDMRTSSDEH
jgi:hypothetical protein